MQRIRPLFATIMLTAAFAACAQAPPPSAANLPFYVPTTLIVQTPESRPTAPSMLALQVLPAADWEQFFVPRDEKFAFGATSLSEVSAYSVLVYDSQRISGPNDNGYRYTWAVRQGIEFP